MTAAEAAAHLGVSRATLYAYVSRGRIRSQAVPGRVRERGYARDDVERLRRRAEERKQPGKAAAHSLQWGLPILESAITLIDGHRIYYRGHEATVLATTRTVEEVATLVWTGTMGAFERQHLPGDLPDAPAPSRFIARAQTLLAAAAAADPGASDTRAEAVRRRGGHILRLLTRAATRRDPADRPVDAALARAWRLGPDGAALVRAALILSADHELNVSSFTARAVASAGSGPYAVVIAALAALEGARHGGSTARAEAMLGSLGRERQPRAAVAARLQRGERLDGFGHPLYPDGDPRAAALLAWVAAARPASPERRVVEAVARAAEAATGERANLDYGLAALAHVLRLPAGAPLMLFAIGRAIGWIGHALEQYATGQLIRPRAQYVGVRPA
ncbi:MAG: citrate synthase family protein [Vicinamibacterales bacterium]